MSHVPSVQWGRLTREGMQTNETKVVDKVKGHPRHRKSIPHIRAIPSGVHILACSLTQSSEGQLDAREPTIISGRFWTPCQTLAEEDSSSVSLVVLEIQKTSQAEKFSQKKVLK